MRPETGPMQFGDDWRGVFIRGDSALMRYVPLLNRLREQVNFEDDLFAEIELDGLIRVLKSANQHQEESVQLMKPFKNCKAETNAK